MHRKHVPLHGAKPRHWAVRPSDVGVGWLDSSVHNAGSNFLEIVLPRVGPGFALQRLEIVWRFHDERFLSQQDHGRGCVEWVVLDGKEECIGPGRSFR